MSNTQLLILFNGRTFDPKVFVSCLQQLCIARQVTFRYQYQRNQCNYEPLEHHVHVCVCVYEFVGSVIGKHHLKYTCYVIELVCISLLCCVALLWI